jgi:hypothetical protein
MKSSTYDTYVLSGIQTIPEEHPGFIYMHENAACHRSRETQRNLARRGIRIIQWPRYSQDLDLIKHVWNWMKNYILEHYWQPGYNVTKIPLLQLKAVI